MRNRKKNVIDNTKIKSFHVKDNYEAFRYLTLYLLDEKPFAFYLNGPL